MTEKEWLTCLAPENMLDFLEEIAVFTDRKQRLIDCSCVRRLWHLIPHEDARRAIEFAEDFADGLVDIVDLREIQGTVLEVAAGRTTCTVPTHRRGEWPPFPLNFPNGYLALSAAAGAAWEYRGGAIPLEQAASALAWEGMNATEDNPPAREHHRVRYFEEQAHQAALIREIIGNPFLLPTFSSEWQTDTVLSLARHMYDSRDFSAMPILADALQDAGCGNTDVLDHCRGPGPHVRGCWVVDLILGKE